MAKEICVLRESCEGIPEDALFSIRAGSVRRQAAFSNGKPYRFPKIGIAESPVKIDILQPIGTAYIVVKPGHSNYHCTFKNTRNEDMSCELEIRTPEGEEEDDGAAEAAKDAQTAKDAKAYLESHSILSFVQAVLQTVVKERPLDPYEHIARHFACGYDISDPAATRAGTSFLKSKANKFKEEQAPEATLTAAELTQTVKPTPLQEPAEIPKAAESAPSPVAEELPAASPRAAESAPAPVPEELPAASPKAAEESAAAPVPEEFLAATPKAAESRTEESSTTPMPEERPAATPKAAESGFQESAPAPVPEELPAAPPKAADAEQATPAAFAAAAPVTPVCAAESPVASPMATRAMPAADAEVLKLKMRSTLQKGQADGSLFKSLEKKKAEKAPLSLSVVGLGGEVAAEDSAPAAEEAPAISRTLTPGQQRFARYCQGGGGEGAAPGLLRSWTEAFEEGDDEAAEFKVLKLTRNEKMKVREFANKGQAKQLFGKCDHKGFAAAIVKDGTIERFCGGSTELSLLIGMGNAKGLCDLGPLSHGNSSYRIFKDGGDGADDEEDEADEKGEGDDEDADDGMFHVMFRPSDESGIKDKEHKWTTPAWANFAHKVTNGRPAALIKGGNILAFTGDGDKGGAPELASSNVVAFILGGAYGRGMISSLKPFEDTRAPTLESDDEEADLEDDAEDDDE